ncbi:MAG: hypothetical protein ACOZNI_10445 [Myxococcota bacterium]
MTLFLLAACNSYEVFRVTGFEQSSFSNDADILFVIDNSSSMEEETSALALNIEAFINKLTSAEGANVPRATLTDAVGNYLRETSGETLFIDYQLAITTTTTDINADGVGNQLDPGEAGLFIGDVIQRSDEDPAGTFRQQMLCNATCWNEMELASDPDAGCDVGDEVTIEYLDCICGVDAWKDHCGGGDEEGIEAATLAICRAMEPPLPDSCLEYVGEGSNDPVPTVLGDGYDDPNEGFLREGATTVVVIVTDEGDGSPRVATGDPDVEPYVDIYEDDFENPVRFAVMGPAWDGTDGSCLEGAQPWAVERYQNVAAESFGMYAPLTDIESGCTPIDISTNLESIGELLSTLMTLFPLQQTPDAASIEVWVDDEEVGAAELLSGSPLTGDAEYGTGWTYNAAFNAVQFHGEAVPDYNSDVRIYYVPLGGTPREIPF